MKEATIDSILAQKYGWNQFGHGSRMSNPVWHKYGITENANATCANLSEWWREYVHCIWKYVLMLCTRIHGCWRHVDALTSMSTWVMPPGPCGLRVAMYPQRIAAMISVLWIIALCGFFSSRSNNYCSYCVPPPQTGFRKCGLAECIPLLNVVLIIMKFGMLYAYLGTCSAVQLPREVDACRSWVVITRTDAACTTPHQRLDPNILHKLHGK